MTETRRSIGGRLRAACDRCHQLKLKCSYYGPGACSRCHRRGVICVRSDSKPVGRPNTSKKKLKKTTPTQKHFPDSMEMRSPENLPSNSPLSDGPPVFHASSLQGENASSSSCSTQIGPSFEAWSPQSPLSTLPINLATPTGYAPTPVDRKNTEFTCTPMALNYEPWYGDLPGYPENAGDGSICICLVAIMCAVQEAHSDSSEKESVCYKLRLNRDSLTIMKDFLACKYEHDPSLIVLAHILLYKVTATFLKAVSMPCDRIFHFGFRTIEGPDVEALRRKITSIGIQKVKSMLKQLSCMTKGWKVEGRENIYGPVCAFIQSSVRKQADNLLKRVGG